MLNLSALLDRLINDYDENGWVEFKENNIDPEEVGQYISALANTCILKNQDKAFLIFGVQDQTKKKVGTNFKPHSQKKGGENFINWITRLIEPRIHVEFLDFSQGNLNFVFVIIEPTYERPVRFQGIEYIRIGENKRKLIEFPDHERALWLITSRRKFENAIALSYQTVEQIFSKLNVDIIFTLSNEPKPTSDGEFIRKLIYHGFVIDSLDGHFDITNLGAILLAKKLEDFPSIATKSIRLIKYKGRDKQSSEFEQEGQYGYAMGFPGLIKHMMGLFPKEETYVDGIRRNRSIYPEVAIREVIANALIHQDFTISGSGPVIEIYSDRVEVINPGNCLINTDRIIDERKSRNEKLAAIMRIFGLCEERGGGLDKTLIEIERMHLPAPEFISSENSMRVVIFGPKPWSKMNKGDKIRACFHHCVIRWIMHDYMSNATLRARFSLNDADYQAASAIISEAIKLKRIAPADIDQGKRNARYIPYWAAES